MFEKVLVSILFIVYGLVATLKPELVAQFQTWTNKVILGAEFKASKRTLKYYRSMGLLFLFLAGLLVTGVIE